MCKGDQKFYRHLVVFYVAVMFWALPGAAQIGLSKYPEESFREKWDKGCSDWGLPNPMVSGISVSTIRKEGFFRIQATAKIEVFPGQSLDQVHQIATGILVDGLDYPKWVMPGINTDPEGNAYFVKLDSVTASNHRSVYEYAIRGLYSLSVLWFKREGFTSIIFKHENSALPACAEFFDLSTPQLGTKVTYRMTPRQGVLDYMIGEAYVSRAENHLQLKLRAVLKPSYALYQVIPEKMIRTQVDQRARKIFENFLNRYTEKSQKAAH